jgi:ubiquinone/menaquinone biosynthesis C-methylase UbiE
VLDVGAGTGHLARALAAHVHHVVALDLTLAMLQTGPTAARDAGFENVLFQVGDAAALPFLKESFDLVVSRFALHHFKEPRRQLEEMCRVCRREGHVVIIDLVSAEPELPGQYTSGRDSATQPAVPSRRSWKAELAPGCDRPNAKGACVSHSAGRSPLR